MKKSRIDVSIVILTHNVCNFLKECLDSIRNSKLAAISYEVIVIDNASTDKTIEVVKKEYPEVILIKSKKNLGFAAGNNLAKGKPKGKYILFLNPDTVLQKNALAKVYQYMEKNKDVGVSTCRLELVNGDLDVSTHRGFPNPINALFHFSGFAKMFPKSRLFSGYNMGWKLDDKMPHEVDAISGAFFFVKSDLAEDIGWWDADYYWYGEDLEFCYQIKERGAKIMFIPQIKSLHYKGVTSGFRKETKELKLTSKRTRRRLAKASTDAMKIFYQKHYQDKYPQVVTKLIFLVISLLQKNRVSKV